MSGSKTAFQSQYTVVQVIKARKDKKTSIVRNSQGQYFVAKKFYMSDTFALNQIGLMKTIKHPNIVSFHDIIMEKGHIYLIQQFCQEGDLAYHIRRQIRKKRCYFQQSVIKKWLLQLLLAIEYLHSKKIMHRDIRPENIFLTAQGNLKLGCFRSSKLFNSSQELSATAIGSPYYMAPQCLQNLGYDQKVDIWAFGCIIYQLCSLKSIFKDKNVLQQANLILKDKIKQIPLIYSKQLQQIYSKCLQKTNKNRASARILLRQQYFMEQMMRFIQERPSSSSSASSRVPIKHYNVHFNVLANKKKEKDVEVFKQKYKLKRLDKNGQRQKSKQLKNNQVILPKIQQGKSQQRRSSRSIQRVKTMQSPKQTLKKQKSIERVRQRSKQIIRKKSINKNQKQTNQQQARRNQSSIQKRHSLPIPKKVDMLGSQQSLTQSPKKLLAPPLLPKPPTKKSEKKQNEKISLSAQTIEEKVSKSDEKRNSFNKEEVNKSLSKIFQQLNIKQQDEQEFQFQLEDENLARLTLKPNQDNDLKLTYKSKLQQLIEQINYKYCPNMEPIQERTMQFDSNTFANIRGNNRFE